jgi:hypothetical protein
MSGLAEHLHEAIAVNRRRRPYYARKTGNASWGLSTRMIVAETLLLPGAWVVDAWAERYHRRGVGIVRDDVVSMETILPKEAPPRYRGQASEAQKREVRSALRAFRSTVLLSKDRANFAVLCHHADALLDTVEQWERSWRMHWAMTKHLVESLGYTALHGIRYAEQTSGDTRRLTRCLLAGHALLLPAVASLDLQAQSAHRQGAGILVNDVPTIPFQHEGG